MPTESDLAPTTHTHKYTLNPSFTLSTKPLFTNKNKIILALQTNEWNPRIVWEKKETHLQDYKEKKKNGEFEDACLWQEK